MEYDTVELHSLAQKVQYVWLDSRDLIALLDDIDDYDNAVEELSEAVGAISEASGRYFDTLQSIAALRYACDDAVCGASVLADNVLRGKA